MKKKERTVIMNPIYASWLNPEDAGAPPADVFIVTSGGRKFPAHASVLAMASPVLENMLYNQPPKRVGGGDRVIHILGIPCDAVDAFLRLLYSSRVRGGRGENRESISKWAAQLLVLSHAYRVAWLKRACEDELASAVTADDAVDVIQLARRCDAPRLYVSCLRLIASEFAAVRRSDGWRFVEAHDPRLELEILQNLHDLDMRKKQRRRKREEQEAYLQLSEAMECLEHICTEGCTEVGPWDIKYPPSDRRGGRRSSRCPSYRTCEGLQLLIRHFASCAKKLGPGGCIHCKRMGQLFRLHTYICDQPDTCRVPLCKRFKMKKKEMKGKEDDERWRILARKVCAARVMSSLAKRRKEDYNLQKQMAAQYYQRGRSSSRVKFAEPNAIVSCVC